MSPPFQFIADPFSSEAISTEYLRMCQEFDTIHCTVLILYVTLGSIHHRENFLTEWSLKTIWRISHLWLPNNWQNEGKADVNQSQPSMIKWAVYLFQSKVWSNWGKEDQVSLSFQFQETYQHGCTDHLFLLADSRKNYFIFRNLKYSELNSITFSTVIGILAFLRSTLHQLPKLHIAKYATTLPLRIRPQWKKCCFGRFGDLHNLSCTLPLRRHIAFLCRVAWFPPGELLYHNGKFLF